MRGWTTGDGQTGSNVTFEVRTASGNDPTHQGTKYAHLATSDCGYGYLAQSFRVPPSSSTGGPALKVWYRSSQARDNLFVENVNGSTLAIVDFVSDVGWTEHTQCLPPQLAGQVLQGVFALGSFACVVGTPRTLDVDDLQLTTDMACPR